MNNGKSGKIRILIDQDEVLTNFRQAACRIHGRDLEQINAATIETNSWSMPEVMGISHAQFWKLITEAGSEFWQTLEPLPWYKEVIKAVEEVTDDWRIVTSPSHCPSSYVGKILWMRRYLGRNFDKFHITPHKGDLAKQGVILIDDREANINNFIEHGGSGIVFPSVGNYLHEQRHNPVQWVVDQLNNWKAIQSYYKE